MTNPTDLKYNLLREYNQLISKLQQLQGAIAACNELGAEEVETEETTTEEESTDA